MPTDDSRTNPRFHVIEQWVHRLQDDSAVVREKVSDLSQRVSTVHSKAEPVPELVRAFTELRIEFTELKTRVITVAAVATILLPIITTVLIKLL